jgi:hypothetical protein
MLPLRQETELEAMTIVARWLKERASCDRKIIRISGPIRPGYGTEAIEMSATTT